MAGVAKELNLRYATTCHACSVTLPVGVLAWWDRDARAATCVDCAQDFGPFERGRPGASALRVAVRRRARWEQRIRTAHPTRGGLMLETSEVPQWIRAWEEGAAGERQLAKDLEAVTAKGVELIHDRAIPGTRANIDHIAIGPAGVFVIDAKHYRGEVERLNVGSWFRRDDRLYVARRDRTKLITAVAAQLSAVSATLAPGQVVPVTAVVCFVGAEWGWRSGSFQIHGVWVASPSATAEIVSRPGSLSTDTIYVLARRIAKGLPPR